MYTSPPPVPQITFTRLLGPFLGRSVLAGLKYGALAGLCYGAVAGAMTILLSINEHFTVVEAFNMIVPFALISAVVGVIVGPVAGALIGLLSGIVLSVITYSWFRFNPSGGVEIYRKAMGSASVAIPIGIVALLSWNMEVFRYRLEALTAPMIFFIIPGVIGAYYSWKASQQLARWYMAERSYEAPASLPTPTSAIMLDRD